jgi:hypothetical protein
MGRHPLLICVVILGVAVGGCAASVPATLVPPSAAEQVKSWLECEECTDGELRHVVRLGDEAVPGLAAALQHGPAEESLARLRKGLLATYAQLKDYGPVPMTEEEYVRTYTENVVALYQVRAATALGAIGGAEARRTLEKALGRGDRQDVQQAIRTALAQIRKR